MKSWKVDVPVSLNIWTRTEIQKKTFEAIKCARPSKLFLISDGPRNDMERRLIEKNRSLCEDIDWECEVHKLYMDENQGMYAMFTKGFDFVFSYVDRCVFLEDDVLVSDSFFPFCAELLEKYKDDTRIQAINGMNYLGKYREKDSDYFFSNGNCILGYAMWKRTYEKFYTLQNFDGDKLIEEITNNKKYKLKDLNYQSVLKSTQRYLKNPMAEGHPAGTEFYRSFLLETESQMDIIPTVNMVTNIGGTNEGTHISDFNLMPKKIREKYFNQERHEITWPLRHPQCMMRDYKFEKLISFSKCQKVLFCIEKLCRNLYYLGPIKFCKKVFKKLCSKRVDEK